MFTDIPWRKELVKESCVLKDGALTIPDTPGLGIEINEEAFAKFPPCREHNLHHYNGKLTGIRPALAIRISVPSGKRKSLIRKR